MKAKNEIVSCPSCNLLRINGILCHEIGCPDSHLFVKRTCRLCKDTFEPEHNKQDTCSDCLNEDNDFCQ